MPSSDVISSLALWLHLRRRMARTDESAEKAEAPPGTGPLVLIHLSTHNAEPLVVAPLIKAMRARRPALRFALTGAAPNDALPPDLAARHLALPHKPTAVRDLLERLSPRVLLLLGDDLPPALIAGMAGRGLPIILAEARLARRGGGWWRGLINRGLMRRLSHILAPDTATSTAAHKLGIEPERIEVTGPVTETLSPLRGNEAERSALAQILRGRHIWLAAAPTLPEIRPLLLAHQNALQHNHRALLILAGLPPDMVPMIQPEAESLGLATILRSEDDDPMSDDHVLIAEDTYELGLWYRLAPVSFMGGTLHSGPGLAPRHPFEPAALGSAIIHGPLPGPHTAEWAQLAGASAARRVSNAETLSQAVSDLAAPDQAAFLAGNAWSVSTGGAVVIGRIADTIIDAMENADEPART